MGADAFIAFYGLRFDVGDADEADALSPRNDHRLAAAKEARMDSYTGRLTDGEPHFLYVGKLLGSFGVEGDSLLGLKVDELWQLLSQTDEKLDSSGLAGERRLWFQLEAQY